MLHLSMVKIAIYAGSFNPWHKGHQYVLSEGEKLFTKVRVVRAVNPSKIFDVHTDFYIPTHTRLPEGVALGQYANEEGIEFFIRGIRNTTDFDYEYKMSVLNKEKFGIQTIYIPCDPTLLHINSSMLRELHALNVDISEYLV